jgi:hypothetical protein
MPLAVRGRIGASRPLFSSSGPSLQVAAVSPGIWSRSGSDDLVGTKFVLWLDELGAEPRVRHIRMYSYFLPGLCPSAAALSHHQRCTQVSKLKSQASLESLAPSLKSLSSSRKSSVKSLLLI